MLKRLWIKCILLIWSSTTFNTLLAQNSLTTDVLIVGGGISGTAAAIQAARLYVKVVLVEPTPWLGGMLSSAGVSAIDGNHKLPSGLWKEFRDQLYTVYGGAKAVETGWVSNTLFEPYIADSILKAMVAKETNITVHYGFWADKAEKKKEIFTLQLVNAKASKLTIQAKIVIDATELGDIMALLKVPFDVGMEGNEKTGEQITAIKTNTIVQDLTYTAILKDYGATANKTIPKPVNYIADEFDGVCKEFCKDTAKRNGLVTAEKMLTYAKLPNQKYLINWPNNGNDTYMDVIALKPVERTKKLEQAKQTTLRFLYFIQTTLGYKNLGLADDEFPTTDKLPLIAYYREGRRVVGLTRLKLPHLLQPYSGTLYKTGIAVGDYPIDHHHKKNKTVSDKIIFPPISSYNIPLGCLIPQKMDGLIVAEKGISVSNVVNGTTRLQPVVLLIGQAAGVLAAVSITENKAPKVVAVRKVQEVLLNQKAYIMPYIDIQPGDLGWESIQKIGATGILKGTGIPYKWANQTWFYPDSLVKKADIDLYFLPITNATALQQTKGTYLTINQLVFSHKIQLDINKWLDFGLKNFDVNRPITRKEYAIVLDKIVRVFNQSVNTDGLLIR
jgi:FAD dependent oxidoreductase